jgi:hypothetical protein
MKIINENKIISTFDCWNSIHMIATTTTTFTNLFAQGEGGTI